MTQHVDEQLVRDVVDRMLRRETAAQEELGEPTHAGVAVQAADTGRILMIQRKLDPEDAPEVRGTWEFPGGGAEDGDPDPQGTAWREFNEETGLAQPTGEITGGWRSPDGVYQGFVHTTPVEAEAFEHGINPAPEHRVIPDPDNPECREPDVQAWFTREQIVDLGAAVRPEVRESTDWSQFAETPQDGDDMPDEKPAETEGFGARARALLAQEPDEEKRTQVGEAPSYVQVDEDGEEVGTAEVEPTEEEEPKDEPASPAFSDGAVPWHGVLAPEGVKSGDGRSFKEGSLDHRPLPLPLTWQRVAAAGHDGNVTIAKIERIKKINGENGETLQVACGHFISNPEADELIGLVGEFGRFGVSIDADDVAFELDEDSDVVEFSYARTSSASVVSIPAFHQAWVALGEPPEGWGMFEGEPGALVAAGAPAYVEPADIFLADFAVTEDGPGWLTHPVDTDRLRDYWVRGEGAAKIGWGAPGDFNRCRVNLAKYIKPQHLAGYCANRHYDALGVWPGQEASGETSRWAYKELEATSDAPAEALSLVAGGGRKAPAAWFTDPQFAEGDGRLVEFEKGRFGCPLTITEDGQVYGHLATWDTCHIAFKGHCQTAPHSLTDYRWFRRGGVLLDDGQTAATGVLSIGGGHAGPRSSMNSTMAHYDSTSTAACDVTAGEDDFGIWVAGWVRPGTSEDMVTAMRASALSGDWREMPLGSGQMELVAALAVNVPGFGIPRVGIGVRGGSQVSLVAAGVVPPTEESVNHLLQVADPEALSARIADEVWRIIQLRTNENARLARLTKED